MRRELVPTRHPGVVRQTGPALHGAQPGDVRGGGRQRADHAAVHRRCQALFGQGGESARSLHRRGHALAVVHRAVRQLRRGRGRGARQGPGRSAAPHTPSDAGQAEGCWRRVGRRQRQQPDACADLLYRAAPRRCRPGRGRRHHPGRRRSDRRHRLGGRKRHHRRERAGDPRGRRRPQRRHRRHAPALRLARGARDSAIPARASSTA